MGNGFGSDVDSEDDDMDEHFKAEKPPAGKLLAVNRRALSIGAYTETKQRDNLFHSCCLVDGKVLSVVIDGGSCTNVISLDTVKKFVLSTIKHPQPYTLHWLNNYGNIKVNKKAKVCLQIGDYVDEIWCDVAPMQAARLLFGRLWQYDREDIYDGRHNSYWFKRRSTGEVQEDQQQVAMNWAKEIGSASGSESEDENGAHLMVRMNMLIALRGIPVGNAINVVFYGKTQALREKPLQRGEPHPGQVALGSGHNSRGGGEQVAGTATAANRVLTKGISLV
ncbi:unnamed protein product [Linum trigynum]|uniref:Uncharacterized protein n=1 Tax=Linum trigynum TaxID=586398 RepID=A0AAV2CFL7_9ROSI